MLRAETGCYGHCKLQCKPLYETLHGQRPIHASLISMNLNETGAMVQIFKIQKNLGDFVFISTSSLEYLACYI